MPCHRLTKLIRELDLLNFKKHYSITMYMLYIFSHLAHSSVTFAFHSFACMSRTYFSTSSHFLRIPHKYRVVLSVVKSSYVIGWLTHAVTIIVLLTARLPSYCFISSLPSPRVVLGLLKLKLHYLLFLQ